MLLACTDALVAPRGAEGNRPEGPPGATPTTANFAAHLVERHGDVRWLTPTTRTWRSAPLGQGLAVGDEVQTMERATAEVHLAMTGARIDLEPRTVLRIPDHQTTTRRIRHISGRLRAHLDPEDGPVALEIRLPPGDLELSAAPGAGVIESRVEVANGRTDVVMVHGRGVLRRPRRDAVLIEQAGYATLAQDGSVSEEGVDLPAPDLSANPTAVLTRGAVELRWPPIEGAASYQVTATPTQGGGAPVVHVSEAPAVRLALSSGTYRWCVRILDREGRLGRSSEPADLAVEVDRLPPVLEVDLPRAGGAVGPLARVTGRTEPHGALALDGRSVPLRSDGSFSIQHPVPRGLSNLVIRARDRAGNVRVVTRQVVRSR